MKALPPIALLLLAPLASAQTPAPAPAPPPAAPATTTTTALVPKSIGSIVDMKPLVADAQGHIDKRMSVDYSYGADSNLILVVRGVEMNGSTGAGPKPSVGGELLVQGNQIKILPKEIYTENDPAEIIKAFSVRYIVPKVQPGIYRLLHDDSAADGEDRIIDISLDLRKPVKKTLMVSAKSLNPPAPAPPPPPPPVIKDEP